MPEDGPGEEKPTSRMALAAIVVGITLVFSLLICEFALRVLWENPFANEQTDWFVEIETQPPFRNLRFDRSAIDPNDPVSTLRTDERGYILPGRRFEAADATIAFLGGSTTENPAVREDLRFPAQVSTLLEAQGLRVNVINAGKSGVTSHDALNTLLNHVVEDHPDIAVLMEAHNDVGMLSRYGVYRPRGASRLGVGKFGQWFLQTASTRLWLAGALRKWTVVEFAPAQSTRVGSEAESMDLPYDEYLYRLRAFVGICRAFGIQPVLMTQPSVAMRTELTPDWIDLHNQERFNEIVRRVAADEGALLIDNVEYLAATVPDWKEPNRIFYDGVHVNDEGSTVLARHIADRLQPLVERIRSSSSRSR